VNTVGAQRRILVAEDSPTQAERTRLLLEDAGYHVEVVPNGREGLQRVQEKTPDLIISDVMMPEMDGYTFCRAIKSNESTRRIPFVLLTDRKSALDIIKGLERGADNFITKPFEDDILLERIHRIFEHLEHRKKAELEMEVSIRVGRREIILSPDKQQIIELLFSTFEDLCRMNKQLEESQRTVEDYARNLEERVEERTQALQAEIAEHKRAREELRKTEAQLLQAQKMEAIGQLTGGIAHDFNNMLTVIMGYSELMLQKLKADDPLRSEVEQIKEAGNRASLLTRQLLAFSRKQVLQPRVLDLNAVLTNLDKMLQRLIGEDIALVTMPAPGLGRVKVDPGQIEQVIMNLAVNARDAMPNGGKLTIETANVELDNAYAREHVSVRPGPYVMLAVSDTGCGMDAATQARIFEPFFTTKEPGKGTGLGLSTVYGIVKQSDGNIWVYSEPGRGTTFKIYLPRVEAVAEAVEPSGAAARTIRGSETILLVEDENAVRALIRSTLQANGYTVLEAHHGKHAIQVCEQHAGPIHLMVTDVVMPEMSGRDLAERLKPSRPNMKVFFMSGYTDKAIVNHGELDPGTAFLQKPFIPDALARKVREVLDGS